MIFLDDLGSIRMMEAMETGQDLCEAFNQMAGQEPQALQGQATRFLVSLYQSAFKGHHATHDDEKLNKFLGMSEIEMGLDLNNEHDQAALTTKLAMLLLSIEKARPKIEFRIRSTPATPQARVSVH